MTETGRTAPDAPTIRPGIFFGGATAALAAVTAILLREAPAIEITLAVFTVGGAGFAAWGVYRMLVPFARDVGEEGPVVTLGRRAVLERDKMLTLRSLKELEFDRAMGKITEPDFVEMRARLRARAIRLIQQLEGGASYRELIERDVRERLRGTSGAELPPAAAAVPSCPQCATVNESDARFCKMCGHALG